MSTTTDETLKSLRETALVQQREIEAQTAPLHAEADLLRGQIARLEAQLAELTGQIALIETTSGLRSVRDEVARLSRAISTTRSLGDTR